ncbi:MAG: protein kinase, partial [Candidatus Latescibacteria bacterium]|nr:protein kinase [Candidatus Latescibacterota bacterium]
MFCDKCGTENRDEAEFCTNCGNRLGREGGTPVRPSSRVDAPAGSELDYIERFKAAVSGRYEVIREIGRGGMAIVFLAKDTRLERKVALKLLPQEIAMDKNFTERFMREAKISAKLAHPNIIQIHDVDNDGEFTYYSMSYIEGISLAQIIKKGGALAPKIVTRLGIQICFALQQAHEKGVIHRDIKPENILINKKRMPIVVDFGIARAMSDSRLSSTGMFIGTPQYMSPEQIQGTEVDARSDIYCMGVMLYEMATGKPPFRSGDTASLMYK